MIGAIIADRWLGKYRTIFWLSLVYCAGHAALAAFESPQLQKNLLGTVLIDPIQGLYLGLALIAVGSGGIKPCVSANVGDQFGQGNWHLLQKVFNAFYFIINFGSAFATLLIPAIRGDEYTLVIDGRTYIQYKGSVSLAFAVPGILMGLATLFFWMGRKKFVHVPPTQPGKLGLLDVASGTALFMVIGYPIFFHEFTPWWGTLLISYGCLSLFAALFAWRQRLKADDGFLAVMFYAVTSWFRRSGGADEHVGESLPDSPSRLGETRPRDEARPEEGLESHWFFGRAARHFGREAVEGPIAVLKIMSVFLMVSVFWALFDQHSSTWIEQAKHMNRTIKLGLAGWLLVGALLGLLVGLAVALSTAKSRLLGIQLTLGGGLLGAGTGILTWVLKPSLTLDASQVPALNPFMVMVLIPYTTFGLYPLLKRIGIEPTPLRRMTWGMFVTAAAFAAVALVQHAMDARPEGGLHVGWQLIPYLIITVAEVMVSVTGLEFAYSQAPRRMKSVIMGFWLFNVTLGNLLVVFLSTFKGLQPAMFFWTFAGLMALAAALFGLRARFYRYQDYAQ
jgi:POT family proton-dependent oligopeptide transporter